jgi:hypothetical protein
MYTSIQEIKGIVIQQFYPESKLKTFSKELLDGLVSIKILTDEYFVGISFHFFLVCKKHNVMLLVFNSTFNNIAVARYIMAVCFMGVGNVHIPVFNLLGISHRKKHAHSYWTYDDTMIVKKTGNYSSSVVV